MPMYNLIEYSDNYQDSSATLYQYKRDEPPDNNVHLTADNSTSFKYNVDLLGNIDAANPDNARVGRLNVKIVVPLKYLSNFFRSLEMPLIMPADDDAAFIINDTKLYVPVVTLPKEDNKDFIKQQNKGFQRCIYWNQYKTK